MGLTPTGCILLGADELLMRLDGSYAVSAPAQELGHSIQFAAAGGFDSAQIVTKMLRSWRSFRFRQKVSALFEAAFSMFAI